MKKSALGRGLGALIQPSREKTEKVPVPESPAPGSHHPLHPSVIQIAVEQIKPNRFQPRKEFVDAALQELCASIKEKGVITPVLVRKSIRGYELIAGERRFRASQLAGLKTVPAIIKDVTDEEALELALIENIQREDLNPLEEAKAFKQLADQFNLTHEQVAQKVGKDRSTVTNILRLLELPESVQEYVSRGTLSMGHARTLLGLPNGQMIEEVAKHLIQKELSVRATEAYVHKLKTHTDSSKPKSEKDIHVLELENKLRQSLGTKVSVQTKGQGGQLVITYQNLDELDRILNIINKG